MKQHTAQHKYMFGTDLRRVNGKEGSILLWCQFIMHSPVPILSLWIDAELNLNFEISID